ncbi:alkaline phosphatase family protein [Shewanella pneumatophori]|uniref:Alkaline phosphatase family protein n=1 Tax=Shewanella pneumatophori TaxID=314092 RepID=A0A9X1ZCI1_9GAMM|nr:alkaline phosphatase family protein [Shewanella pneumatophori]MCL1139739.1 alkaline phosphatase family protein [Shewanella pneumatophori]
MLTLQDGVRYTSTATRLKTLTLGLAVMLMPLTAAASSEQEAPKLILQITVDQLRGDMLSRYQHRFAKGGFNYLLNSGVVYKNAQHAHANTETIVGHTTLSTGAYPANHGMVGNVWFDRSLGHSVYNIEDARYPLLSADGDVNKKTEIDPTQKTASSSGRSPMNILVSTFSDELALTHNGKAKVFGVSVKDRGAVAMAGHAGKAFWFSKKSGEFVTSAFYYQDYPEWVKRYNTGKPTAQYANQTWQLAKPQASYLFANNDDQEWEVAFPGFGRVFPHQYGARDGKYFTTFLTLSPAGDELTADFAKRLIENEAIGQDEITDYLSVSFSSTDYVGHIFGPSSLEAEDNLLHLDNTLADFLSFIDDKVGLDNTVIVLSADHGSPESPEYLQAMGIDAQYVHPKEWHSNAAIEKIKQRFKINEKDSLINKFQTPYLYLNHDTIAKYQLNTEQVQTAVADEIAKLEGVAFSATSSDINQSLLPNTHVAKLVANNHHPQRSGDIYIVFKPHYFINEFDGLSVASSHGSPWRYDTFVPLIFAGKNIESQTVTRAVETVDIATTLATIAGTKQPSGSDGKVLSEVLE